jgi:hypothetical protein
MQRSDRLDVPLLSALSAALILASCGDGREAIPGSELASLSVENWAGECEGYCRRVTEVGADLVGHYRELAFRNDDPTHPPQERSFVMTSREWQDIAALVSFATRDTWQGQYGCPDCADQGGWRLGVKTNSGTTRMTVLDGNPAPNPAPLQRVIDAVRDLHAEAR